MSIRTYAALLLLFFMACDPISKKKAAGNVVSTEDFNSFVNALTMLETPTSYVTVWDTVTAQYMFKDSSLKFKEIHAVRLKAPDNFIAVLYNGVTEVKEKDLFILATYTNDGKLIEKSWVFETDNSPEARYRSGKIVMEVDSVIEVRNYFLDKHSPEEEKIIATSVKNLVIRKDGHHQWKQTDKGSFQAFIANFPVLQLPYGFTETPATGAFPQITRDNGWFDLKDLLRYDFPSIYKIGKFNIPGFNHTICLLKTKDVITNAESEGVLDDAVYAVVYDNNGRELDRLMVTGGEAGEDGYSTSCKDFTIDANGKMQMTEETFSLELPFIYGCGDFTTRLRTTVTTQGNGRFDLEANDFEMNLTQFIADSAHAQHDRADTIQHSYSYLGNYPGENINVLMHNWTSNDDYVYELMTVDANYKILDAVTIASKLPSGKQPDLHVKIDGERFYIPPVRKMKASGLSKVLLKDQTFTVGVDGKLTKAGTENIAAAIKTSE